MVIRRSAVFFGGLVILLTVVAGLAFASPEVPSAAAVPSVWASPREIDFGPVATGDVSDPITVTFTNNGTSYLSNFTGGEVGAPFLRSENTCDFGLPPGTTCSYKFTMSPETAGDFTIVSHTDTDAGPVDIVLHGRGVGPQLSVSPLSFDFGSVVLNQSAAPMLAGLSNTGWAYLDLDEITDPGGPFKVTSDCGFGLPPGDSCTLQYDFSPTTNGSFTGTSTINTTGGSAVIDLRGLGRTTPTITGPSQQVTPRSIDFGPVAAGLFTVFHNVTFYNQSSTDHLEDWSGGAVDSPFAMTTDCQDDIDPATSCYFSYSFSPTAAGTFSTTATITNNLGTIEILLQGEGLGAEISSDALSLEFPPVAPGTASAFQVVTFRNTGVVPLTDVAGGAPYPPGFGANTTCANGIPVGGTCHTNYNFKPDALGGFTAVSLFSLGPDQKEKIAVQLSGGLAVPDLQLAFDPDHIKPGEMTTLHITIVNPNPSQPLTGVSLNDDLPPGLVVAGDPMTTQGGDCYGGAFQPAAGGSALPLSSAVVGNRTCELAVDVTTTTESVYHLTLTALSDSGPSEAATATLVVASQPIAYLAFLPFVRR